jgi:hypothetical protein
MKSLKFIISVFSMLMFSVLSGGAISVATGFDPLATIGTIAGISTVASFFPSVAGVLPMAIGITSAYAGEVLEQLLVRATTGNQIVAGGHIHVQPNVLKKFAIPRLKAGKMLQRRIEQPVESNSKGDFTIDEKYLEPKDVMAFTTFNPRVFENIWRPFQTTGNLVFAELPSNVQSALLAELAKVVDFELGGELINGEYHASDAGKYFDGILTRITADSDVVEIATPVAITQSNVIAKMKLVRASIPKAIKANPNLKLFMSVEDAESYEYELTDKPSKGADYSNMNPERFKGIQIVALADWPKDVIVAAVATSGIDSNFWAGVALTDDAEAIQIDKLTAAGEKYFFKMLMKVDTNIVFGEDIVKYDGRDAAIAAGSTDLDALVLSAGDIVPAFAAGTKEYTMSVANNVSTTTVTATKSAVGQTIKLGSTTLTSAVASAAKNLAVGENIINVAVTSADGNATATYQVLVTRASEA